MLQFSRRSGAIPRESTSAGFSFEGTCLHCEEIVFSCILDTLFAMKMGRVAEDEELIHASAISESVQRNVASFLMFRSFCKRPRSSTARQQAQSSSRGIVACKMPLFSSMVLLLI